MNKHSYYQLIACPSLLLACLISSAHAMTVSGPITASSVTVTGDVTMSSMTVSSITITNLLDVPGTYSGIPGRVLQMVFASTTVPTQLSGITSFTAVSAISQSITLSNANDYVRISLSGGLFSFSTSYITIYRDSTNLGDSSVGLASVRDAPNILGGVSGTGITITDFPGDTNAHTYQPYIRTSNTDGNASFPYNSTAYLFLEEISQ